MIKQTTASTQSTIFYVLEFIFVICTLLILTGLGIGQDSLGNSADDVRSSGRLLFAINYVAYSLSILLALLQYKKILKFAYKNVLLSIFIFVAFLSVLWSENSLLTLRSSIELLAVTLFGIYLATRYSLSKVTQLLCLTLAIVVVSSLVLAIISPASATVSNFSSASTVRWRGILAAPTQFGRTMALSTIVWLFFALQKQQYRFLSISFVLLSSVLTLLSRSVGSYIALLIDIVLITVLITRRGRYRNLILIAWIAIASFSTIVLMINYSSLLSFFNRDLSLTGRVPLWTGIWEAIAQQPWLGYGYGAFWTEDGSASTVWAFTGGWKATHAHNGLLDIWLYVGLLGLLPFLLLIFKNIFKAIAELRYGNQINSILPIALLTHILIPNFVESVLSSKNIFWVLYVFLSIHLNQQLKFHKNAQHKIFIK